MLFYIIILIFWLLIRRWAAILWWLFCPLCFCWFLTNWNFSVSHRDWLRLHIVMKIRCLWTHENLYRSAKNTIFLAKLLSEGFTSFVLNPFLEQFPSKIANIFIWRLYKLIKLVIQNRMNTKTRNMQTASIAKNTDTTISKEDS